MNWEIVLNNEAQLQLLALKNNRSKQKIFKAVMKTIALMQVNLRHPSLRTHQYHDLRGPEGEKVFEAYVQQNTPGAYRIFWYYGPHERQITIVSIIPHPNH